MKKIPTIFQRETEGQPRRVIDGPSCVDLNGAVATRKWDGTCCLVRDGKLYKRYQVKPGKKAPDNFEFVDSDANTGKQFGWVPVGDGPEDKWHREAKMPTRPGTYELLGPKVQGNSEQIGSHGFVIHGGEVFGPVPTSYEGLEEFFIGTLIEGIVWWKDGKPIGKIKRKDFGLKWPTNETA